MVDIVLATGSLRRIELIKQVVDVSKIIKPLNDEKSEQQDPYYMVMDLAEHKAAEVAKIEPNAVIIGADTVVVMEGKVLGKPKNPSQATSMLKLLSGRSHLVYTGICLLYKDKKRNFVDESRVTFYELTDTQIADYIKTGSPFDKAGGYGVQDSGFVQDIEGSYHNVMGLPTKRLKVELDEFLYNL
ncbi:MAG: Maf family protein [Clostridia bacterium]